ncbi:hypothetical protein [Spartinivicinus ruber]|uniref:hypothetical protein n=1 Tax=Spartinivicinus ruber TaxID=2683272 RepID=UPI0013D197CC|nr:hypothetical protein [Spartinivicinus ruber]
MLDKISQAISDFLDWVMDGIAYLLWCIADFFMSLFGKVLGLIPVPDFMHDANTMMAHLSAEYGWYLSIAEFSYGMKVLFSALLARFVIKLIPFIG